MNPLAQKLNTEVGRPEISLRKDKQQKFCTNSISIQHVLLVAPYKYLVLHLCANTYYFIIAFFYFCSVFFLSLSLLIIELNKASRKVGN